MLIISWMRSKKHRKICCNVDANYFKPRGIPLTELKEVILLDDELEAVKLNDLDLLYQEESARRMNVSRQTFGRILKSAHKKIADAVINSKALRLGTQKKGD
jgi:uncharacterized protein